MHLRRATGAVLIAPAVVVGGIAALWTLWRAAGAEADFCPGRGGCISAYAITLPAIAIAILLGMWGWRMLRDGA